MPLISKAFSNLITFSRTGGAATYFAANGVLTTAANNEPRFDYDPATFLPRGLLIEEQRTNSIRNNTMQGAVAGTPGTLPTNWPTAIINTTTGLTREIVSVGTEDGINYIDFRISGTAVGAGSLNFSFEPNTQIVAVQNQVWNVSCYRRLVAGSFNGLTTTNASLFLNSYTAAGAFDATATSTTRTEATPTSAPLRTQRADLTGTLSSATTARVNGGLFFIIANGAVIDITLRIGLPQLEQGAFATSVIPTTTTALTRNQDRAVINTLAPWFNATTGTIYAEFAVTQPAAGANQFLARFSDNSYNNQIGDFINTTGFVGISTASGGVFDGLAATAVIVSANTITKAAGAYATNDLAAVKDGGAVATDNTATIPSGLIRFDIGSDHGGLNNIKAGYLRRIIFYPTRLSNAQLQTITT